MDPLKLKIKASQMEALMIKARVNETIMDLSLLAGLERTASRNLNKGINGC